MTSKTSRPRRLRRSRKLLEGPPPTGAPPDDQAAYAVGYGRPPKHSRFKPGQSGNPKGRSPRARSLKGIVTAVLEEQIQIREGGLPRRMPRIEALVRMTVSRSLTGDAKAFGLLTALMKQIGYGTDVTDGASDLPQGVDHEGIVKEFLARVAPEGSLEAEQSVDSSSGVPSPAEKKQ